MSDNNVFLIDGEVQTPKGNAKVKWLDRKFFIVSFNGKKALDKEANIHFKSTNLLGLLYAQGYSDNQIIS